MSDGITQDIHDFYNAMLDGDGVAKMIDVAARKRRPISRERIRRAAVIVYHKYQAGTLKLENPALELAKQVYKEAVALGVDNKAKDEAILVQAKDEFKDLNAQVLEAENGFAESERHVQRLQCELWHERKAYEGEIIRLKRGFWQKLKSFCKRGGVINNA